MPGLFSRPSEIRFHRHALSAIAALLMAAYAGAAFAQSGTGNTTAPNSTTPESHAKAPSSPAVTGTTKNGVIRPKGDVDPNMAKPPPAKGTTNMPVIKPKGTPGGQPGPTPK